jgi:hypothetical protein
VKEKTKREEKEMKRVKRQETKKRTHCGVRHFIYYERTRKIYCRDRSHVSARAYDKVRLMVKRSVCKQQT